MIFGAPALLWALPLATVPLAFHLIFRRRAKRVTFSDTALLRRAYSRTKPLSRLRQWFLVAARCLILLLLVLAAAQPIMESSGTAAGAGAHGVDALFLLDESYSMRYREGGKTRFEQSVALARAILSRFSVSDRAAIEPFSAQPQIVNGQLSWISPAQAAALLASAKPGYGTTDYASALAAAQDFLEKDHSRRRRVAIILSDDSRHGLKSSAPALDASILWLGLSWPTASNLTIASAKPESASANAAGPTLHIDVSGFDSKIYNSENRNSVEVWQDSHRLPDALIQGQGLVRQAREALPAAPSSADAAWWGRLELRPDALGVDDEYFYSLRQPARPRVLCLYSSDDFFSLPEPGYFLRPLLGGTQGSLLPFDADFLRMDRLPNADLSGYRIVLLADSEKLSLNDAARLKIFVSNGGGLLAISGAVADPTPLAHTLPWLCAGLGPSVSAEQGGIKPGNGSPNGAWDGFDLSQVSLGQYNLLEPKPGAHVMLASASGYPLLVLGSLGRGKTEVWAGSLNAAQSSLVIKPVFAAWMQTALNALILATPNEENLSLKIGEPIIRRWPENEPAPAQAQVQSPEGRLTPVWLKNRVLEFSNTATPGLYTILDQIAGKRWVYAVNLDRSTDESDLSRLASPPWKSVPARTEASLFSQLIHGRSARDWFMILAVLVLTVEMLLALGPRAIAVILLVSVMARPSLAQQGDRFVWTQIKLGDTWDPYPDVPKRILAYVTRLTSILVEPERRVITLDDPALFSSPLIVLAGGVAPQPLSEIQKQHLRDYLDGGGLLWIEDVSGSQDSSFDLWVRSSLPQVLPGAVFEDLSPGDVIYKTFFLLRGPAGRIMTRGTIEKIIWQGHTAVLYSRNDILGAWAVDPLGKPLFACLPGGEDQREKAERLTLNLIMFSLTGTYKDDAVHQPYILMKMRSGIP